MYQHDTTGEELNHRALQNRLGISFPMDQPPVSSGWSIKAPDSTPPTPATLLARQQSAVRQSAEVAYVEPVTDAAGATWNGGFDSALKMKAAADMAEFAGLTQITLYDLDNAEHPVTLAEAKQVAATIGEVFQQKLAAKQAAMRALKAIDLDAPDADAQIEAITFDRYWPPA